MEVARSKKCISSSQRKYTFHLLKEAGKLGYRPAGIPRDRNLKQKITEEESPLERCKYTHLMGRSYHYVVNQILHYLKSKPRRSYYSRKINTGELSAVHVHMLIMEVLLKMQSVLQGLVQRY